MKSLRSPSLRSTLVLNIPGTTGVVDAISIGIPQNNGLVVDAPRIVRDRRLEGKRRRLLCDTLTTAFVERRREPPYIR